MWEEECVYICVCVCVCVIGSLYSRKWENIVNWLMEKIKIIKKIFKLKEIKFDFCEKRI